MHQAFADALLHFNQLNMTNLTPAGNILQMGAKL
jgi:hypothetical protein